MTGTRPDETAERGTFGRLRGRLVPRTAQAVEAATLISDTRATGATPIAECVAGERFVVHGTVRSLTLRPRGGVLALEAELYDGSGRITLVWLGRRQIRGVDPGRTLVARGRATHGRGTLVIYNPSYELRPSGSA
jgi:RecG-like helicase